MVSTHQNYFNILNLSNGRAPCLYLFVSFIGAFKEMCANSISPCSQFSELRLQAHVTQSHLCLVLERESIFQLHNSSPLSYLLHLSSPMKTPPGCHSLHCHEHIHGEFTELAGNCSVLYFARDHQTCLSQMSLSVLSFMSDLKLTFALIGLNSPPLPSLLLGIYVPLST